MVEYLKKNYLKLVLAAIFLVGFVFVGLQLLNTLKLIGLEDTTDKTTQAMMWSQLAITVFFLLGATCAVLKTFAATRKYVKFVLAGTVAVTLVFLVISLIVVANDMSKAADGVKLAKDAFKAGLADEAYYVSAKMAYYWMYLIPIVTNFIVFVAVPAVYTVKKFLKCGKKAEATAEVK